MEQSNKLVLFAIVFVGWAAFIPPVVADTANIEATRVTPHMEAPIKPGQNVVFCSTFQIAWNHLKNDIIKDDIRLEKPLELIRILNLERTVRTGISEGDYLAVAGYGSKNIADEINQALKRKFGDEAPTVDNVYNQDDVILAYAFLLKVLQFENAFEDFKDPMTFHGGDNEALVESFGIYKYSEDRHRWLGDKVEVLDYEQHGDFIVRLESKHPDDEIILARVKPGKTLLQTYEQVDTRIARSKPEGLSKGDLLMIPKIDFSLDHQYSSLVGLHVLNKGFEDYFVQEARQDIRFTLDESGASVKSAATLAIKKGPPVDFKMLVFHDPFMIYLKKRDAKYPYLAMWIGNPDLMVESN
ncbi:MAG: hypothetical protein JSW58_12645 [Candidatus Latescibacterota bacterium]|nr:MAG: hypothetical protein JSW58_12645 [Candidatus Latescibacterota bacterium]